MIFVRRFTLEHEICAHAMADCLNALHYGTQVRVTGPDNRFLEVWRTEAPGLAAL